MSDTHQQGRLFTYRAVNGDGVQVSGQMRAEDMALAARELGRQGLTPLHIEPVSSGGAVRRTKRAGKAGIRELGLFLQELSTLLQAGVSLADALPSLVGAYANQALGPGLEVISRAVRAGSRLSDAISQSGWTCPGYVIALVKAGEASGDLAHCLAQAASQLEYEQAVSDDLKSALIYPTVLVVAGVLAVLGVFVGVVPKFATMLKSSRATIPALSRWVIESGVYLQQHLFVLTLVFAAVVAVTVALLVRESVRDRIYDGLSRLPLIGTWLRSVEVGRWSTVLGTLLASRVPFVEAIQLSSITLRSARLRQGLKASVSQLQQGRALSELLEAQAWFPEVRLNLIRVGERSGELPRMLRSLGDMETRHARLLQKRVLAMIEPAAILLIGAVIGVVMVAVMMAVTSLNSVAV